MEQSQSKITLKGLIIKHEGLRLKPYRCSAGKLTIGVGRNLDDVGITREEAEILLNGDIERSAHDAMTIFPRFFTYSDNRQNAIIDMLFNLGKSRFMKFKKMIKAIYLCDWEEASLQAKDSRWYKQVGVRAGEDVVMLREG